MKIRDVLSRDNGAKIDTVTGRVQKVFWTGSNEFGESSGCEIADDTGSISVFLKGTRRKGELIEIQNCIADDREGKDGKIKRQIKTVKGTNVIVDGEGGDVAGGDRSAPPPVQRARENMAARAADSRNHIGEKEFKEHFEAVLDYTQSVAAIKGLDWSNEFFATALIEIGKRGVTFTAKHPLPKNEHGGGDDEQDIPFQPTL